MSQAPEMTSLKPFVWAGIAFGTCMGLLTLFIVDDVTKALRASLLSGGMFGFVLRRFVERSMSTTTLEVDGAPAEFEDDEGLLHHGPANHFKGMEAVGGKLFLTTRRLRFRSHKMNVQNHDSSYPLSSLGWVEPCRTFGLVPNGLLVHLHDGTQQRFVVHGRARWLALIQQQLGGRGAPAAETT